jgi:hypothetical protein
MADTPLVEHSTNAARESRASVFRGPYRAWESAEANKEAYCAKHGYRFVCRTDGFDRSRAPSWSKVPFIREELPRSEWVFWTDADALVMDSSVPLTRFIQDSVDVVLSGDPYNGVINAGHLLVKNTMWSDAFLERVYRRMEYLNHPWWGNTALIALDREDPDVRRHVAVVPNKLFNAYPTRTGAMRGETSWCTSRGAGGRGWTA